MIRLRQCIASPAFRSVVFHAGFFMYAWLRVDTAASYYAPAATALPLFETTASFARAHLARPGGPVDYVAAFLSQLYVLRWAGALVLTAVAATASAAADGYFRGLTGGRRMAVVRFVPPLLMLMLCNVLAYRLAPMVSTAVVLSLAWLYSRAAAGRDARRGATVVAFAAVAYCLVGGAVVIYALLCALLEWVQRRRLPVLLALLSGEAVPYLVGVVLMGLRQADAFAGLLPGDPGSAAGTSGTVLGAALVLAVPVIASGRALLALLPARAGEQQPTETAPPVVAPARAKRGQIRPTRGRSKRTKAASGGSAAASGTRWRRSPVVRFVGLLCMSVAVLTVCDASGQRTVLAMSALASAGRWEAVLRAADRHPQYALVPVARASILRALYYTGRLPDDLFEYPMGPAHMGVGISQVGVDLGNKVDVGLLNATVEQGYFGLGDVDLQLGLVNEHEHRAQETLAAYGEAPQALESLALVNIVKGRPQAAKVFLRNLSHRVGYGAWARGTLARMQADPSLSSDPDVARVRAVALIEDSVTDDMSVEARLLALLDRNPRNRMAFEYLMALYLLTRQPDKVVAQLGRLDDLGRADLPRTYEEAILLHQGLTGRDVDLGKRKVRLETYLAYDRFRNDYKTAEARPGGSAVEELAPRYGNTFFYYYTFGLSGVGDR